MSERVPGHQLNLLLQIDAQLSVVRYGGLIGDVVTAHRGAQVLQSNVLCSGKTSASPYSAPSEICKARAMAAAIAGVSVRSPTSIFDSKLSDTPARCARAT
jgi:hypothetical protein